MPARSPGIVVSLFRKHLNMKKHSTHLFLSTILFYVLFTAAAQAQNVRGFYVNGFNSILGNSASETTLLNYTQANGYNYLCLYSLGSVDMTSASNKAKLASFINRAKTQYGVTQVGVAGEIYSFFANYIIPYNAGRPANEKVDVLNFEFEFWITSTIANQYCAQYLTPNHLSCDSAGAFAFAKSEFAQIDAACAANGLKSEVYFGWPNKGQMQWFAQRADRILLHAYRTSDSDIYSYTKARLMDISSINSQVEVIIIFSSESIYMGPWLQSNPITKPYETYSSAFSAETGTWKANIKLQGFQWFKYSTMPPTSSNLTATITSNGPVTFCPGGSVTLSVTSGVADTYQWMKNSSNISGATNSTYNANSSGDFAVKISKAGSTGTSTAITVNANSSIPQPVITASGPLNFCPGGSVTLTSSSITGNHWSTNETTQSIVVTASGNYSVTVTAGNCTATSTTITVSTSGNIATPTITLDGSSKICPGAGVLLISSETSTGGYTWSTGETTKSIYVTTAGTFWVKTGTANCNAQSEGKIITMKSAPATPTITANGSTNLGEGGTVKLTSSYNVAYLWNTSSSKRYINVTTAGTYYVTVTGSNGCKATSAPKVVTSSTCTPPPIPVVTSNSQNNFLSTGQSIVLKTASEGGYLWSSGDHTQSITVTTPGVYSVRTYNGGNCYSTSLPFEIYAEGSLGRGFLQENYGRRQGNHDLISESGTRRVYDFIQH
jgi:hypothetical protein